MNKKLLATSVLALLVSMGANAQRFTDKLDRGLVAVKTTKGVYCSWRIQADEYYDVKYNLYRDGTRVNAEPLDVSNFTDGTISVIAKRTYTVEKVIYVGGMPKGIFKYGSVLYVADYLKSKLILIEDDKVIKVIAIESEPNAMTLF